MKIDWVPIAVKEMIMAAAVAVGLRCEVRMCRPQQRRPAGLAHQAFNVRPPERSLI